MNKPYWTTGEILWTENYDDSNSETFAQAWFRLFGEEIPYWNEDNYDQFFADECRFIQLPKGRVICYTEKGGHIQLDPTYNEKRKMFKNIQVDPSITYTDSNQLYAFIFGRSLSFQVCTEYDAIIINYLKEIEAIGVTVYIKDFVNHKFQYQTIGISDDCKRVDVLMDNCSSELKNLNSRSRFEKMFVKIRNWFSGSFNNPTLAQADDQPLVLPTKETKAVVSEEKITDASNDPTIKPLVSIRTKGIRAWFRGSFNNPKA